MRVRSFSVLFLLTALFYIIAVASEVFIDDFVAPSSLFLYLLVGTLLTGIASLAIDLDVPD